MSVACSGGELSSPEIRLDRRGVNVGARQGAGLCGMQSRGVVGTAAVFTARPSQSSSDHGSGRAINAIAQSNGHRRCVAESVAAKAIHSEIRSSPSNPVPCAVCAWSRSDAHVPHEIQEGSKIDCRGGAHRKTWPMWRGVPLATKSHRCVVANSSTRWAGHSEFARSRLLPIAHCRPMFHVKHSRISTRVSCDKRDGRAYCTLNDVVKSSARLFVRSNGS